MSPTSTTNRNARDLMEPLRVCLGWSETVREAAARLREHGASAAPVVRRGHPTCLMTLERLEGALRLGLGEERVGRLTVAHAPRAAASTRLRSLARRARGTTSGLLVGGARGPILGVITRTRIVEALERSPRSAAPGPSLRARMSRALSAEQIRILRHAGEMAGKQKLRLHLVGGVVRDLLLGSKALDLDLVVEKDGPAFARQLATSLGGHATVHSSFGTAVVSLPGGSRIDVATMRREGYLSPAALPRVEAGSSLDDLSRRDVTINAMAIRLDGTRYGRLVDEMGGRSDLLAGLLRVHHIASICEDPTRAFRIARFAARFGFRPTVETRSSIRLAEETGAFDALTGERLFREFGLVADEPDPASAVAAIARLGLLRHLGGALRFDRPARRSLVRLIAGLGRGPLSGLDRMPEVPILILMALVRGSAPRTGHSVARRLKITGEMRDRLVASRGAVARLLSSLRRTSGKVGIVRACDRHLPEVLAIAWAEADPEAGRALDGYLRRLRWTRPAVTGEDLEAMGLAPGPAYRVILGRIREAKLSGRVRGPSAEKALAERLVRRLGQGSD